MTAIVTTATDKDGNLVVVTGNEDVFEDLAEDSENNNIATVVTGNNNIVTQGNVNLRIKR